MGIANDNCTRKSGYFSFTRKTSAAKCKLKHCKFCGSVESATKIRFLGLSPEGDEDLAFEKIKLLTKLYETTLKYDSKILGHVLKNIQKRLKKVDEYNNLFN